MAVFDEAWIFLKNEEDQPTTSLPEIERILNQGNTGEQGESPTQESAMVGSKEAYLEQQLEQLQQIIEQKESLIQELRERQKKLSVAGRFQ